MTLEQKFAMGWLVATMLVCVVGTIAVRVARNRSAKVTFPDYKEIDMRPARSGTQMGRLYQSADLPFDESAPTSDDTVAHCDRVGNAGWHGWQNIRKDMKTDM